MAARRKNNQRAGTSRKRSEVKRPQKVRTNLRLAEIGESTAKKERVMLVAAAHRYAVKDRVALATDPKQEPGTVAAVEAGRYFVRWDSGRTWIYAGTQLVPTQEA